MQRKFTRHLLICINSFNSSRYVRHALELIKQINLELGYGGVKYSILCVFGGCSNYEVCSFGHTTFVSIPQNLSDHNIYAGINHCYRNFSSMLPQNATCVILHDTCVVKPGCFRKMMMKISRIDVLGWVFAHSLGLYNIGVCDIKFAIENSKNWMGITHLDKATSITLEHSRGEVELENNKKIRGLRSYSNFTLNQANSHKGVTNFDELDFHSIVPFYENGQTKHKHVVFIGALGIYKMTHAPGSFLLPIWVNEYAPKNMNEFNALSKNPHVECHTRG